MSEANRWCIAHLLPHGVCDTRSALCTPCPPLAPTDPQATVNNDSPSDSTGPLSSGRLSPGPTTDPQQRAALPLSLADKEQKTGILSSLPYGSPSTRAWGQAWGHLVQSPAPGECIQIMEEMLLFGPLSLKKKKASKESLYEESKTNVCSYKALSSLSHRNHKSIWKKDETLQPRGACIYSDSNRASTWGVQAATKTKKTQPKCTVQGKTHGQDADVPTWCGMSSTQEGNSLSCSQERKTLSAVRAR